MALKPLLSPAAARFQRNVAAAFTPKPAQPEPIAVRATKRRQLVSLSFHS